jgi:hypothetical protein
MSSAINENDGIGSETKKIVEPTLDINYMSLEKYV